MTPTPPDQAIRDRVRTDFATTLVLEAGAGTGKTKVLVDRLVNLVATGTATLDRVAAITFTDAAAGELNMRLRAALEEQMGKAAGDESARLARAIADLERAQVSTIHAFASALLRERPFEAGIDPGFQVLAEVAGARTFDDAWNEWLSETLIAGDEALRRALHLGLDMDSLRDAARRVVAERDVLGGPVATRPFDRAGLLGDLESAVRDLTPQKSSCLDESDGAFESIVELEARLAEARRLSGTALEACLRRISIDRKKGNQNNWRPKAVCVQVKDTLNRLADAAESWVAESDADVNAALRGRLSSFLERYEARKAESALADFQDLLLRARDVLAQSVPVRRYFQAKFDRILVDEFQDTDPLQSEIVAFLAEDPAAPPAAEWRGVQLLPGKLFVVGDPKQSVYRFRRADLQVYEQMKALVRRCGGEVLPLTTNFRTVPSVIRFVNEQFREIFTAPGDPAPIDLQPYRAEADSSGARAVALTVPAARMPAGKKKGPRREAVAETIAAFVDHVTRVEPWSVYDPGLKAMRAARPGDVAILVRKMTPDFIAPYEASLRARQVRYRLAGGKEYFARDEVRALAAVLWAIDNPADQLALVQALRSPFFGVSDADLLHFVSTGGKLRLNEAQGDAVARRDVFEPALALLSRLHDRRRFEAPSAVIEALFRDTRALAAFLLRPSGAQMVANLWKVLGTARAYEAAGPTTLRTFVRFLRDQDGDARDEGDAPVGEAVEDTVEIATVHKSKGLEYPIVIVADLLTEKFPPTNYIVDHTGRQGWMRIGPFQPDQWKQRAEEEARQQQAEGRRLLYVALTRARDHLVIPCLPGEDAKSWLAPVANTLVRAVDRMPFGEHDGPVTWFDSRALVFGVEAPSTPGVAAAVDGSSDDGARGAAAEEAWTAARKAVRRQASAGAAAPARTPSRREPWRVAECGEQAETSADRVGRADGVEAESLVVSASRADDAEPTVFGKYVHEILERVDLSGVDLEPIARTLASKYGVVDDAAAQAVEMVRRVLALPVMAEARAATRIFREVPMTGVGAHGRADLLFEGAAGWRVVDFKTDRLTGDRDAAVAAHREQLAQYSARASALVGAPVSAVVCFVRSGESVLCD